MSRRNGEPGACDPAGGAAPTWRIRLGLGEREQSQGKLLIALKPAVGSEPSRGSCVTAVVGNSRRGVQGVVSELVKRCTAHLYSPTPLALNGKTKVSVCKNLSVFSHI